jgi:hypothetical protein
MIRRPPPNLDSTAAATYSPREFELATAVDAPPPEEFGFGGAAVVVVSPDDVDVEPRDADTSVPSSRPTVRSTSQKQRSTRRLKATD